MANLVMTVPFNAFNKGEKAYMAFDIGSAYASTGLAVGTLVGVDSTGKYVKADQATGVKAQTFIYEGSRVDEFGAYSANPLPYRFPIGARESDMLGILKEGVIEFAYDEGTAITAFRMVDTTLTGTVAKAGTTAVTGTGTAFLTELKVGDFITIASEKRQVVAIASNTALTVDVALTGTASGLTATANGMYGVDVYLGDTSGTTKFSKWLVPQFTLIPPTTGEGLSQRVGWVDGKNKIRIDLRDKAVVL
jgi:hypothetical protein